MTKKEELKWRLGKLPTPDELRGLVQDKILTQEEAREILFSKEKIEERSEDSLKSEIKFLRELVEKLAQKKSDRIVEVIKDVEIRYIKQPWYQPYYYWSSSDPNIVLCNAGTTSSTVNLLASGTASTNSAFSAIKSF